MKRFMLLAALLTGTVSLSACAMGEGIDRDATGDYITITHTQRGTLYWE
ncbi:MAG: hypothetical protein AAGL89_10320 [Pseudomonadota bacterium]